MKIVPIFAPNLFAFVLKNEKTKAYNKFNELEKTLNLWNNTDYLYQFARDNQTLISEYTSIEKFIETVNSLAVEIEQKIELLSESGDLNDFFKALRNNEYKFDVNLSRKKGKNRFLRLYAIKIDENCFAITGGAIKLTRLMKEHTLTNAELIKLEKCKSFLEEEGIYDADSFYEFLNEKL
jgi:hypothetical protein